MREHELKVDRQIDPENLDLDALEQADLYCKWAIRAAHAKAEAERLELEMDVTEARLQIRIRRAPERYKLDAVTEAGIKAAAKCHPEYLRAATAHREAKLESALTDRAEKAMTQRKSMIEELVKLHGQSYFAGPKVPHNIIEAWKSRREQVSADAAKRVSSKLLNRRKKGKPEAR